MSISMLLGAMRIGDMIDKGGYRDPGESMLEVGRHYRKCMRPQ